MRKKLFLITVITALLFTMCGLTALADETDLTVNEQYATRNGIELEMSKAVTAVPAVQITERETGDVINTAVSITENDGKRIKIALTDGAKLDLDKIYNISVTGITDGTSTLSFDKILGFKTLFKDDFEGYNSFSDLHEKYYYSHANGSMDFDASVADIDTDENGNKRVIIKKRNLYNNGNDAFLTPKGLNEADFDNYVLDYDAIRADTGVFRTVVGQQSKYQSYSVATETASKKINVKLLKGDGAAVSTETDEIITDDTASITQIVGITGDAATNVYRLYVNNNCLKAFPAVYNWTLKYEYPYGSFGFSGGTYPVEGTVWYDANQYCYVDNIFAYKPVWRNADDLLTIGLKYATRNGIEINTNKALTTAPTAVIKDITSKKVITSTVSLDNENKRIKIALSDEKFDVNGVYAVSISGITDGIDSLDFNKVLTFKTLFKDDFESYESFSDLQNNYVYNNKAVGGVSYDETVASVDTDESGNKRLKLSKRNFGNNDDAFIMPSKLDQTAFDSYVLEYDAIRAKTGALRTAVGQVNKYIEPVYTETQSDGRIHIRVNSDGLWLNSNITDDTTAMTQIVDLNNKAYRLYAQNNCLLSNDSVNYIWKYGSFGFSGGTYPVEGTEWYDNNQYCYVDNILAYKPLWIDATEIDLGVSGYMLSAKLLTVTYNSNILESTITNGISLTANGADVETVKTLASDGKTVTVTPVLPLEAGKVYLLTANGIADNMGNSAGAFVKKFVIEDLWNDDFSGYITKNDLDSNYTMMPTQQYADGKLIESKTQKPSDNTGVAIENGKLKLTGDNMGIYTITPFIQYPNRHNWNKDYIMEVDFDRVSAADGLQIYHHAYYQTFQTGIFGGNFLEFYTDNSTSCIHNQLRGWTNANRYNTIDNAAARSLMFRIDGTKLSVYDNDSLFVQNTNDNIPNIEEGDFAFKASAGSEYLIDNVRVYKINEYDDKLGMLILSDKIENGTATGEVCVYNTTSADLSNYRIYTAVYDGSNKLLGLGEVANTVKIEPGKAFSFEYSIPVSNYKTAIYVRAFLWDSENVMTPKAENYTEYVRIVAE